MLLLLVMIVAGGKMNCTPLKRQKTHKHHTGNLSRSNARTMLRRIHIRNYGEPPEESSIIRHLCENDSTMPNGWICCNPEHIVWGTQSENVSDQYAEIGRRNIDKQRTFLRSAMAERLRKPEELIDPCPNCGVQRIRKFRCLVKGKLCKRCC
jgi:hypothetical protein